MVAIRRDEGAPASPAARRWIFNGFRWAAVELFGPGALDVVAAELSAEARRATIEPTILVEEWISEAYVMEWYDAVYRGPAKRDMQALNGFLDRMMDHGFGRVRKFLLGIVTPATLIQKSVDLWTHDHNTGYLSGESSGNEGTLWLRDHVYVSTALSRQCITEIYRYAASLTRATHVVGTHKVESADVLAVRLRWAT